MCLCVCCVCMLACVCLCTCTTLCVGIYYVVIFQMTKMILPDMLDK